MSDRIIPLDVISLIILAVFLVFTMFFIWQERYVVLLVSNDGIHQMKMNKNDFNGMIYKLQTQQMAKIYNSTILLDCMPEDNRGYTLNISQIT